MATVIARCRNAYLSKDSEELDKGVVALLSTSNATTLVWLPSTEAVDSLEAGMTVSDPTQPGMLSMDIDDLQSIAFESRLSLLDASEVCFQCASLSTHSGATWPSIAVNNPLWTIYDLVLFFRHALRLVQSDIVA